MNRPLTRSPLCAVLDLGSNSFHLLVARVEDGRIITVDRRKDMVRLAEGLGPDGLISAPVKARALESLQVFAQLLREFHPSRVRVVGTNTLRAAKDSDDFLEQAEAIVGVPIDIISGHEEGRLIFLGVVRAVAARQLRRLVIDIGGGSTELIVGRKRAKQVDSLFMGCVSYSERFFPDGKVSARAYHKALRVARTELRALVGTYGRDEWDEALGSSGTIRNVQEVIDRIHPSGHVITLDGIERVAEALRGGDRQALGAVSSDRLPVFPGGLAILHAAFLELEIDEMHVSDYALKEGVLYELASAAEYEDTRRKTLDYLTRQFRIDRRQAGRVERLAVQLLPMLVDALQVEREFAEQVIVAAARLHELGLSLSHSGYHKHGAYLLENADMPGFSRREQKMLSFLVLNHRRKLRLPELAYRFEPDWALVLVLRLACLFNRARVRQKVPVTGLSMQDKTICIDLDSDWLAARPLVEEDLRQESGCWGAALGFSFKVNGTNF